MGIISNCLQLLEEKQQYYPKGKPHKQEKWLLLLLQEVAFLEGALDQTN